MKICLEIPNLVKNRQKY